MGAHDGVAGDGIHAHIHQVHVAASALHNTGSLPIQLGPQAVQVSAPGDIMARSPMSGDHVIAGLQHLTEAGRNSLLPQAGQHVTMFQFAFLKQGNRPVFRFPDGEHHFIDVQQILVAEGQLSTSWLKSDSSGLS